MLEILGKTNFDFMGKRKIAFLFSGIMVLFGLIALVQIARGSANLGIDFAGGTAVQLKFDQAVRIEEARKALESNGLSNAELQEFGQDNKLLVRIKASTTIEEKTAERVMAVFSKEFPNNKFVVDASTEIGPTIGKKLQEDALIAIVISFVGIILYIAARFELRFGVAAALAGLVLDGSNGGIQQTLCATGFRDTTRVASGSPDMWRDIATMNRAPLVEAMDEYLDAIRMLRDLIASGDGDRVGQFLRDVKSRRDAWLGRTLAGG